MGVYDARRDRIEVEGELVRASHWMPLPEPPSPDPAPEPGVPPPGDAGA